MEPLLARPQLLDHLAHVLVVLMLRVNRRVGDDYIGAMPLDLRIEQVVEGAAERLAVSDSPEVHGLDPQVLRCRVGLLLPHLRLPLLPAATICYDHGVDDMASSYELTQHPAAAELYVVRMGSDGQHRE